MPKGSETNPAFDDGWEATPRGSRSVDRGVAAIETLGLILASLSLLTLTVMMIVETALRYLLGSPIGWSYDFIQHYLLPAMFFCALASTYRSGSHVSVDALFNRLGPRMQEWLTRVGRLLMLAFSCLVIWAGILATHSAWRAQDIPPPGGSTLSIPTWTWQVLVPVGVSLLAIRLIVDLVVNRPSSVPDWTQETL